MIEVKVNLLKNRLYVTLGRVRKDMVGTAYNEVVKAVSKLDDGFTCITRIIDIRKMDEKDIEEIIKIQRYLSDNGLKKVIRVGTVIDKEKSIFIRDVNYEISVAKTLEDAETQLDEWEAIQVNES